MRAEDRSSVIIVVAVAALITVAAGFAAGVMGAITATLAGEGLATRVIDLGLFAAATAVGVLAGAATAWRRGLDGLGSVVVGGVSAGLTVLLLTGLARAAGAAVGLVTVVAGLLGALVGAVAAQWLVGRRRGGDGGRPRRSVRPLRQRPARARPRRGTCRQHRGRRAAGDRHLAGPELTS